MTEAFVQPRFQAARKKRQSKARIAIGVIVLAAGGSGAAYTMRPAPVVTTPIVRGTAVEAVYATGTVEPFDRVVVKARASGTVDRRGRAARSSSPSRPRRAPSRPISTASAAIASASPAW